ELISFRSLRRVDLGTIDAQDPHGMRPVKPAPGSVTSLVPNKLFAIALCLLLLNCVRAWAAAFQVQLYTSQSPPATPAVEDLPLLTNIVQDGITWTFAQPQRVGRFVNGDYYVIGPATVIDIQPRPTPTNGLHGSMLNIRPNIQRSGFDSRIQSARY